MYSCSHWLRDLPVILQHLGSYTKALLVSQDRRRLFVKPPGPSLYVLCMDGQQTYKPCVLYITRVSAVVRKAPVGLNSKRTHRASLCASACTQKAPVFPCALRRELFNPNCFQRITIKMWQTWSNQRSDMYRTGTVYSLYFGYRWPNPKSLAGGKSRLCELHLDGVHLLNKKNCILCSI
jgi:hypothetical protein